MSLPAPLDRGEARLLHALEPTLHAAAQLLAEAFSADKVDVFLVDQKIATLVALGTNLTPMGQRQRQLGLHMLPLANRDPVALTFETGITYCSGRVDQDESVPVGVRDSLGVRSMVANAFAEPGEQAHPSRRGVVLLSSGRAGYFTERDVPFVETVARWIGLVVHRARLAERVRGQTELDARRLAAEELTTLLAHDLRNYLTPMKMRLQRLRRSAATEQQQRLVDDTDGVLSVRDAGPGIPEDQFPALFTRFSAGAGSVGLGLGLYIARRILDAHGGTLTVESAPARARRFRSGCPPPSRARLARARRSTRGKLAGGTARFGRRCPRS